MGQKVSPIGFRTGVTMGWKSRWFAPKSNFGEFLVEDAKVRRFVENRLNRQPPYAGISSIEIERTREEVKIVLKTSRPGLVIGPRGAEVDKLKEALEDLTNRRVSINIVEIRNPDLDAKLVAENIAEQLKRRASFRRTMKQRCESAIQAGAKGVKIIVSGRLGGAEMSRSETQILGSIPLHTLEADVDYGFTPSFTTYGAIGVKVWIYRGMFGDAEPSDEDMARTAAMTRARRRRERGSSSRRTDRSGGPSAPPKQTQRPGGSRLGARKAKESSAKTPDTEPAEAQKQATPEPQAAESEPQPKGIETPSSEAPAEKLQEQPQPSQTESEPKQQTGSEES